MQRPWLIALSLSVFAALVPVGASHAFAAADKTNPVEVCEVEIHIHENPRVDWDGTIGGTIGVDPGEYHLHQNCVG